MNVDLLQQVREQILAAPTRFDMGGWVEPKQEPCGTACCIGGWAGVLSGMVKKTTKEFNSTADLTRKGRVLAEKLDLTSPSLWQPNTVWVNEEGFLAAVLGISLPQAIRLFYTHDWPEQFARDYAEAEVGSKAAAKVAARRITHFIKTKGEE